MSSSTNLFAYTIDWKTIIKVIVLERTETSVTVHTLDELNSKCLFSCKPQLVFETLEEARAWMGKVWGGVDEDRFDEDADEAFEINRALGHFGDEPVITY